MVQVGQYKKCQTLRICNYRHLYLLASRFLPRFSALGMSKISKSLHDRVKWGVKDQTMGIKWGIKSLVNAKVAVLEAVVLLHVRVYAVEVIL